MLAYVFSIVTPRRLTTTNIGGEFYEQLSKLLDELKLAEQQVADQTGESRGVLRVSCPVSFATMHFKSLAARLMLQYPGLTLDLDCDDRVVDFVTKGEDCAIRLGQLRDSSLIARTIAPNRHVICASQAYLERKGVPNSPEELQNHDGLHYSLREPHLVWHMERNGEIGSFRVGSRMRRNNGELLLEAALSGLGLGILPTFMASNHLASGDLRIVLPQWKLPGGSISVCFAEGQATLRQAASFDRCDDRGLQSHPSMGPRDLGYPGVNARPNN